MDNNKKTFEKLKIIFTEGRCTSCRDGGCHNNTISIKNGIEYNVHIFADFENNFFEITARENPNTESKDDMIEQFNNEHDAADFMCKNFERFTCA